MTDTMPAANVVYLVTEKGFQETVVKLAENNGWETFHDNDSRRNKAGLPDLLCLHPQHGCVWLELKTMKGRVRPEQKYWLDLLNAAGQRAYVIRPHQMDFLEALFSGKDVTP